MLFHLHIDLMKKLPELNLTIVSGDDENDPCLTKHEHKSQPFYTHERCSICKSRQGKCSLLTGGRKNSATKDLSDAPVH